MTGSFRMVARFLRGGYLASLSTLLALALGVALVCAIDLACAAVDRALGEVTETIAGRASLQIAAGEGGLFPEEIAETVRAVNGVALAVPVVSGTAFMADESGESLIVQGVDIADDAAVRVYEARDEEGALVEDPLVFLSQPDSVVLTHAFAEQRGLELGDRITVETPLGRRSFTARGLLEPTGVARVLGGSLLVMDLYAAQAIFTRPGFVNRVDVVVRTGDDVARVADAISGVLPAGLHVEGTSQQRAEVQKLMGSIQVILRGVGLVGLLAGFLIAYSRLATVFEARTWQLGIMRAVGVRKRTVWLELLKQGFLLGLAGSLLGLPLGIALGRLIQPIIAASMVVATKRAVPKGEVEIEATTLVVAVVLGMGTALLAAAAPAWRAARVEIVDIIRGRRAELQGAGVRFMSLVWGLVVVSVAATVALQSVTRMAEWGLAATGLFVVGTALAARPLLYLTRSALTSGTQWIGGPAAHLAVRSLLHNPRRTGLTVAMLGVGLACVLWILGGANSFERTMITRLGATVGSGLIVSSAHVTAGFMEAPVDEDLIEELSSVSGVGAVAASRVLDWPHKGQRVAIIALDPPYFRDHAFGEYPLLGESTPQLWETIARGEGLVVSSNFVVAFRTKIGDTLEIETPTGPVESRIAAITSAGFESPRGVIVMSRELFKRHWQDRQINRAFVQIAAATNAGEVRARIARELGVKYRLRIFTASDFVGYYTAQVQRIFTGLNLIAGMVLIVVLIGLADTLAAGVAERTRQLGTVRALGVRRSYIRRMVLVEGLLIGALGFILAVVTAFSLGVLWIDATIPYLVGFDLDLHIPYGRWVIVGIIAALVCLSAGILPARRAGRLEPAAALRYE